MAGSRRTRTPMYLFAVLGGLAVFTLAALRATPAQADPLQCAATLSPDTVAAGSPSVTVSYSFSEQIGTVGAVSTEEGSGLQVASFNPDESTISLDATSGVPGAWRVLFTGEEEKSCTGSLNVKAAEAATR